MKWLILMGVMPFLMDENKGGEGGGGSGGDGGDKGSKGGDDGKDKLIADLTARLEKLEKAGQKAADPNPDDDDLAAKAEKARLAKEKANSDSKTLSSAIKFNMALPTWIKDNEALLPKNVASIVAVAEKENYATDVEKANAIKKALVSEFFAVQSNLDQLTENQKEALEVFKKLTKDEQVQRVGSIYDSIFEPTFELLKKIRKAQQVRNGEGSESGAENAYKQKLIAASKKKYLGEKS